MSFLWGLLIVYLIVALMFYLQWVDVNMDLADRRSDSYVVEAALLWPWHVGKRIARAVNPPMGSPMDVKAISAEAKADAATREAQTNSGTFAQIVHASAAVK